MGSRVQDIGDLGPANDESSRRERQPQRGTVPGPLGIERIGLQVALVPMTEGVIFFRAGDKLYITDAVPGGNSCWLADATRQVSSGRSRVRARIEHVFADQENLE
jgi:hypothetical protein